MLGVAGDAVAREVVESIAKDKVSFGIDSDMQEVKYRVRMLVSV